MVAVVSMTYLNVWNYSGGQNDWEGLREFFFSEVFAELPLPYISSRLNADLLTGQEKIRPGDPMDVEMLSVALPVSHYVLADKRMAHRIKQRGLDKRYDVKVFSMSTIGELFEILESLR
jgi:hypothetical protein